MVIPQSGKDLQFESTSKGENIAFTPVMPPTPAASTSGQKNVAFILQIRKKYKLQTEPQVEMGIAVLNSSQPGDAAPAIFNYLHGFLVTIFPPKHVEICDVLQSFCTLQPFQANSPINFSREMNGKFQLKWNLQRPFCARCKMKYKWKDRELLARPRHWGRQQGCSCSLAWFFSHKQQFGQKIWTAWFFSHQDVWLEAVWAHGPVCVSTLTLYWPWHLTALS